MELRTEVEIAASRERVWTALTTFADYPRWNPVLTRVTGDLAVGAKLAVEMSRADGSDSILDGRVTVLRPLEELRWEGKIVHRWLLSVEHFFLLDDRGGGRTRVVHGQDLGGVALRAVGAGAAAAVGSLAAMNEALRRHLEQPGR